MRTTIRKAVAGAVGAAAAALGTAMLDGNLTVPEVVVAAGMGLVTYAVVWRQHYQLPAPEPEPEHRA